MSKYHILIKTADQYLAGTDSNIFLQLYGASGISPEVRLNAYISGNAFERNCLDECTVDFLEDFGDIYMIAVRSDMLWASSDWMCDYFTVQCENKAIVTFQLPGGLWIDDTNVRQFHSTAGYLYNLPEHQVKWKQEYGACHFAPPNIEMETTIMSALAIEVNMSDVSIVNTSTKAEVSVEIDAIKAAFAFQIDTSLSKQVDNKLHQSLEISTVVEIPREWKEAL
ncbi:MAG: PLAT/LH2 domain-containing protein [Lachnospiraceae bacterium]